MPFSYPSSLYCVVFQRKGIDGYFYMDQMARMKFRLLHLLLEICRYSYCFVPVPVGRGCLGCGNRAGSPFREHTSVAPWGFLVCFGWKIEHGKETLVGAIDRRPVSNTCFCFSCQ